MDQPVCHAPQDGRSLDFVRIHLYPGKGEVAALMPAWLGYFKKQAAFMKRP